MADITKDDVIEFIANMSVLDLSELVKELEDKFGVSAAAPVAMMAGMPAAGADGAAHAFAGQSFGQQVDGVGFDQDIGEILDPVAGGARVAIDALVLAATVQVHVVLQTKIWVGLLDMIENGFGDDFSNHLNPK